MLLFALSFKNYKLLVGECGCTVHHAVLNQEVWWVKPREEEEGKEEEGEEEEGEKDKGKEEEGEGRKRGISYNGLYGEAPLGRGTFFSLCVCERVGISLVDVYEREGKLSFRFVKWPWRAKEGLYGCKKVEKLFWFGDLFTFKKTVHLQQLKWMQGRYTKLVPFLSKIVDKRVRDGTSGRSLPVWNFVGYPLGEFAFRSKFSLAFTGEEEIRKALPLTYRRHLERV